MYHLGENIAKHLWDKNKRRRNACKPPNPKPKMKGNRETDGNAAMPFETRVAEETCDRNISYTSSD